MKRSLFGFVFVFGLSLVLIQADLQPSFAEGGGATAVKPEVILVQSVPEETNLAVPQIANAKDIWVQMIATAQHTIDLGQFYLSNAPGTDLEKVIQELEKAAIRGVKIRTLVDPGMVRNDPNTYERFKKMPGSELRFYDLKKLTGGIIHAKYFVIDRNQVYIGSQNFDWRALTQIHETGVLVKDEVAANKLTEIFEIDWEIARTGKAPAQAVPLPTKSSDVELVASPAQFNPANVRYSLTALKEILASAKKSIRFQVMDYSTSAKGGRWGEIDDAVRAAAARGVKVELMVADWGTGKPAIDQLKDLQRTPGVSIKIVSIPQASQGCIPFARVMHTKLMVVDGAILWVGTSNWSQSYFTSTRGVEMIFRNAELSRQGNQIFETIWSSRYATQLELNKTYRPPNKECGVLSQGVLDGSKDLQRSNSPETSQIQEFHKVSVDLYRGGRPEIAGLDAVKKLGVKTIINLDDYEPVMREEKKYAEKVGLRWISHPLNAGITPDDDDIDQIISQLKDKSLFPIFIHCRHGQDRTGMVMGIYRVLVQNWSPREAYDEMLNFNFHPKYKAMDNYFKRRSGF